MSNPKVKSQNQIVVGPDADAFHFIDTKGNVIGWIDGTGTLQGNLSTNIEGNSDNLQGNPISPIPPAPNQVLSWNGTTWVPVTPPAPVTNSTSLQGNAIAATPPQINQTLIWDGLHWNPAAAPTTGYSSFADYSGNPILSPAGSEVLAAFGSFLKVGSIYHAYYTYYISGAGQIGHATSADGKTFVKDTANNPVFTPSAPTAWDSSQVGVPNVWIENNVWYMLYRGNSLSGPNSGQYRIGLATSSDGITWTRAPHNNAPGTTGNGCVIDLGFQNGQTNSFDPYGIIKVGLTYYLYFNEQGPETRATGFATSSDLINWTKDPANPTFTNGRYCVYPFKFGSYYYLIVPHYLGGNRNVSTMELYRDTAPTFYPNSRVYLGNIKQGYGAIGPGTIPTPDAGFGFDTPYILTDDITRTTYAASSGDIWMYYSGSKDSPHTNFYTNLAISSQLGSVAAWPASSTGVSEGGYYTPGPITSLADVQAGGPNGFWLTNPAAFLLWTGRSSISSPANGNIKMQNQAGNDFGLLQLGGTTSSFPALKRIGTGLVSRLADDSADSTLTAATLIESTAHTPSSSSDTGTAGQIAWDGSFIYICTATNTWKRVAISTW